MDKKSIKNDYTWFTIINKEKEHAHTRTGIGAEALSIICNNISLLDVSHLKNFWEILEFEELDAFESEHQSYRYQKPGNKENKKVNKWV